jgi:hypothetical protein
MSIALMSIVWRMDMPATDKMVLLALADAANDDGVTWLPINGRAGKQGLMQKTSLSERCIQQCISRLAAAEHLTRDERPGRGVLYTVHPQNALPLDTPARGAGRSRCGAQDVRKTPAPRAPKPSGNHSPGEANASPPPGAGKRASRIPEDWSPPAIDSLPPQAKAMAQQWPDGAYEAEAEAHLNFWLSEGGARARKVDWTRAWCNRIVQISAAVLRAAKAGVRYPASPKPANTDWLARARMAEMRAETYEMMHRTEEAAEQRAAAQRFVQMAASPGLAAQPPPLSIGGSRH